MTSFNVAWHQRCPTVKLGVGKAVVGDAPPPGLVEVEFGVDTGYNACMLIPEHVNALGLPKIRDGSTTSAYGTVFSSVHSASLWLAGKLVANNVEVTKHKPLLNEGLVGQAVLAHCVLTQVGPKLAGVPATVTGHFYPSGPKVLLGIGRAITPGQQKPPVEVRQCILDTGASGGVIAKSVVDALQLQQAGEKEVVDGLNKKTRPAFRVSIWHDEHCLAHDLLVPELAPRGSPVLLGQDFLTGCSFQQDGPNKLVTVSFQEGA